MLAQLYKRFPNAIVFLQEIPRWVAARYAFGDLIKTDSVGDCAIVVKSRFRRCITGSSGGGYWQSVVIGPFLLASVHLISPSGQVAAEADSTIRELISFYHQHLPIIRNRYGRDPIVSIGLDANVSIGDYRDDGSVVDPFAFPPLAHHSCAGRSRLFHLLAAFRSALAST